MTPQEQAKRAKKAGLVLAGTDQETRNRLLRAIADVLDTGRVGILSENGADMKAATDTDLAKPLLKRLELGQQDRSDDRGPPRPGGSA